MEPLALFDRLMEQLRRYQFRLPESLLWIVMVPAAFVAWKAIASGAVAVSLCAGVVIAVGVIGIARWQYHRRKARGGLVVARFSAPGAESRQEEIQRIILASLRDKLAADEAAMVHGVPVVVGADERELAIRLRKRLRARFVLHGRIASGEGPSYSVFARVAQPIDPGVIHIDLTMQEVSYAKASWRNLINRLTAATDVLDQEYPIEFASEIEAMVRGTAGLLAEDQDDGPRAERLLRAALAAAPDSTSHQIDLLRCALARSLVDQDRERDAIRIIRRRARDPAAAPELHRTLERLLFLEGGPHRTDASRREGERALRAAAAHRSDPQLTLSLYNLAMVTPDEGEKSQLLDQLLTSKTHYRDAWYVSRERGAMYWWEADSIEKVDGPQAARTPYAKAATMYTQAIWRRPRVKVLLARWSIDCWYYRTPPIMFANASDAHHHAGHRIRGLWYSWRGYRRRANWFKVAHKAFKRHKWGKAARYFEHVAVVRSDHDRTFARTWEAVALRQMGEDDRAEAMWRQTLSEDPVALSWRALVVLDHTYGLSPEDLPGDEPSDVDGVNARIAELQAVEEPSAAGGVDRDP